MVRRRCLVLFALLPLLLGAGVFRGGTSAQDEGAAVMPTSGPSCARVPDLPDAGVPDDAAPGVYVMNADGSGQTNLTAGLPDVTAPAWSPDGARIAVATWPVFNE